LAFQRKGRLEIIRHDGRGLRRLPQLTHSDSEPAWSPDGRRFAFAGDRPCISCHRLFTVRTDGTAFAGHCPNRFGHFLLEQICEDRFVPGRAATS
jgi:WD40-like Beta Propeller Repeat